MTSNSLRKTSEEVGGAGVPECIYSRRKVGWVLRTWPCLCSHDVEGILGVSGKKELLRRGLRTGCSHCQSTRDQAVKELPVEILFQDPCLYNKVKKGTKTFR